MTKGYYIAHISEDTINNKSIGVSKKICDQLQFFNSLPDTTVSFISFTQRLGKIRRCLSFFKTSQYDSFYERIKDADFLYIRAIIPCNKSLISFLKKIKNTKQECKILWEIPTYPYDHEMTTFKNKLFLYIDKKNRKQLQKVIDYIVTFSEDNEIWGTKTLHITNGVDINRIPIIQRKVIKKNEINLIAVAQFYFWHGYDRLIEGLHNYYSSTEKKDIIVNLHLVGTITHVDYKEIVCRYPELEKHVIFYGEKTGVDLDNCFNIADIGICSLGCHRKGSYGKSSELKSREYLSRGLPIISSLSIDIIPDNNEYLLKISEDDSAINIDKIIDFYKKIYSNKKQSEVIAEIRSFAEEKCTMEYGMKEVSDYLNS